MASLTVHRRYTYVLGEEALMHDAPVDVVHGSILQRWAWGAFKERHGWQVARTAGDGFAVQVLFKRKFSVTIGYVPRGPAVDWADEEAVGRCLAALDGLCKHEGAALALIEPDAAFPPDFDMKRYGLSPLDLS